MACGLPVVTTSCGGMAEAVRDVLRIYVLVIPVLGIASFWEFLSPWNR